MSPDEDTKLKTLEFQLKQLKEKESDLKAKLSQIKTDMTEKETEIFSAKTGVKPGDIIEVRDSKYEFIGTRGLCNFPLGYKIRNNGTPSKNKVIIWDWYKEIKNIL